MQANSFKVLQDAFLTVHASVPSGVMERLARMMDAYMERMEVCNFTAHRTPERFAPMHVVDSLLPVLTGALTVRSGDKVADIGTGGGFPGMPLAVLHPEATFHLFDSVAKKLRVVEEVARTLDLTHLQTHHGRLEEYGQGTFRGAFDVVTSRAVAPWTTLLELALPLLKVGGTFYAYQGEKIFGDLDAKPEVPAMLGARVEDVRSYTLAENGNRYIVVCTKQEKTPRLYPRSAALLVKHPL